MTQKNPQETLRNYRPLLLACEAIGWLHMVDKAMVDFLQSQGGQGIEYNQYKWMDEVKFDKKMEWIKEWIEKEDEKIPSDAWSENISEFVKKVRKGSGKGLLCLFQDAHGITSGVEKQNYKDTDITYLKQDTTHMWLSTAFGHPVRNLLDDPSEVLTDLGWEQLVKTIKRILIELRCLGKNGDRDVEKWFNWREKAIGSASFLRRALMSTIADTRLPNNDVTLWDQSYVAAALFKSAVAGAILEGPSFPWKEKLRGTTRWRLLTVGIGARHYEARAVKIGDWTGARKAIEDFFTRVRKLVEVDLALGSLIYQDSEVAVFTFPGEREGCNTNLDIQEWNQYLQKQIDGYAQDLKLETPPYCAISDEASRSLILLTKEICKARDAIAVPIHRTWDIPLSKNVQNGHVCPVCLARLNDNHDKQRPCSVCGDRRKHRLDEWIQGKLDKDTIWLSEVADQNDRVALLTLSFDLEPWLNGRRLDSLRSQSIVEWCKHNSTLQSYIDPIRPYESLVDYFRKKLKDELNKNDPVLGSLMKYIDKNDKWDTIINKIVIDRADVPSRDSLDVDKRARWLVHQLLRKLPSPGRVYRFWRQTKAFFEDRLQEFRQIASRHANRWRVRRVLFVPDVTTSTGWQDGETYSTRWRNAPLEMVYSEKIGGFVTICNLARVFRETETIEVLKKEINNNNLVLYDDENKNNGCLKIKEEEKEKKQKEKIKDVPEGLGVYHPVIPLELSPFRFRVLVPLEAATECVDRAISAWEEEFGRVWDRLPLRVGVVAFSRKTAFQAVLEAARMLEHHLQEENGPELWTVGELTERDGVVTLHLVNQERKAECRVAVPVKLPDGRDDVFYPYVAVEDDTIRFPHDFRHPQGQVYRHVTDLRRGEKVHVYPSKIATLFLESTACRFDQVKVRYLSDWKAMRHTWKLIEQLAPSQAALRGVWSELMERSYNWRDVAGQWLPGGEQVWLDLAKALLRDRLGAQGVTLELLVKALRTGVLEWSLEWHLTVLKQRVGRAEAR